MLIQEKRAKFPHKLGRIDYANCDPFFFDLETTEIGRLVYGDPLYLNGLLSEGDLLAAPVSSILLNTFPRLKRMGNLGISCKGPVQSIRLVSPIKNLKDFYKGSILLSPHSETSNSLIKILFKMEGKTEIHFIRHTKELPLGELPIGSLQIGNHALKSPEPSYIDLGLEWHRLTCLPFVYAIWATTYSGNQITHLENSLIKTVERVDLDLLAKKYQKKNGLSHPFLSQYYRIFTYRLGESEEKGLAEFLKLSSLIPE